MGWHKVYQDHVYSVHFDPEKTNKYEVYHEGVHLIKRSPRYLSVRKWLWDQFEIALEETWPSWLAMDGIQLLHKPMPSMEAVGGWVENRRLYTIRSGLRYFWIQLEKCGEFKFMPDTGRLHIAVTTHRLENKIKKEFALEE